MSLLKSLFLILNVLLEQKKKKIRKVLQTHLTPSKCTLSLAFGNLLYSKPSQASRSNFLLLALNPSCEIFWVYETHQLSSEICCKKVASVYLPALVASVVALRMVELIQGIHTELLYVPCSEECKATLEDLGQISHSAMLKSLHADFRIRNLMIIFWKILSQFSWMLPQRKYLNNICVGSVLGGVYESEEITI